MRCIATLFILLVIAQPVYAGQPFGQPFQLGVGQSIQLGDNELTLGCDGIPSDSRCPQGVWCFWEGDATANLWLQVPGEARQDFALHTAAIYDRSLELGAYTVTLQLVSPYPIIDVPIDPGSYVVTLVVYQGSVGSEGSSWSGIKALYR